MKISILTLFPEMFQGPFQHSILKHAQQKQLLEIEYINIRDFGIGSHKMVDDKPFGGGVGMLIRIDVLDNAISHARCDKKNNCKETVVLLDAGGSLFTQQKAYEYVTRDHLILICGHYEGVDARIEHFIDEKISIGNYVLTGGEIPAMVVVDTVTRLFPDVLGKDESSKQESFLIHDRLTAMPQVEYSHYTRPREYKDFTVPEILVSGNHADIEAFREKSSREQTKKYRPDLLNK